MKLHIIPIFLFLIVAGHGQVTQVSYTQSLGAGINQAGVYKSISVVGQSASNGGYLNDAGYSGSVGFLTFEIGQVLNTPPVAIAGDEQLVVEGTVTNLDGSESFDPEEDALAYSWASLDGIVLSNPSAEQPAFNAPDVLARRKYRFVLTVNDGNLSSLPDTVTIIVSDPGWIPVVYTNSSTLYALVTLDDVPAEECDHLSAIVNSECRGVSEVFLYQDQAFAVFNIQSESTETVNFEVYDYSEDKICPADNEVTTNPGGDIGTPSSPVWVDGNCEGVSTASIEEAIGYKVIPNPTSGEIRLFVNFTEFTKGRIMVFNLLNQPVATREFSSQALEMTIDLSLLPDGAYIIVLQTEEFRISRKVEKVGGR